MTTWLPITGTARSSAGRLPDAATAARLPAVIEFLIAGSALLFRQQGRQAMRLSGAPLARRTKPAGRRRILGRTLDVMSALLEPTYGFSRCWRSRGSCTRSSGRSTRYSSTSDLLGIAVAIGRGTHRT